MKCALGIVPTKPDARHIEVKGPAKGTTSITVTRNEILFAVNQGARSVLAVVFVGLDDSIEGPFHLANPFQREPDWGVAVANYDLGRSLQQVRAADKNQ